MSMYPYGIGSDHDNAIEKDFDLWKEDLWKSIYKALPDLKKISEEKVEPARDETYTFLEDSQLELYKDYPETAVESDFMFKKWKGFKTGHIVAFKELRSERTEELSTLLIRIKIDDSDAYNVAQNIVMFPKNCKKLVERALNYLGLDERTAVILTPNLPPESLSKFRQSFPNRTHLTTILKEFIDLSGAPKSTK